MKPSEFSKGVLVGIIAGVCFVILTIFPPIIDHSKKKDALINALIKSKTKPN